MAILAAILCLFGLIAHTTAQPVVETSFVQPNKLGAAAVDLAAKTVTLPLHRAALAGSNKASVWFIVTETSTQAAATAWGASHAPVLAAAAGSAVVQRAFPVAGAGDTAASPAAGQSLLRVNATVNFQHGKRSVTPDPNTGFPPTNFSFSAQGNAGKLLNC